MGPPGAEVLWALDQEQELKPTGRRSHHQRVSLLLPADTNLLEDACDLDHTHPLLFNSSSGHQRRPCIPLRALPISHSLPPTSRDSFVAPLQVDFDFGNTRAARIPSFDAWRNAPEDVVTRFERKREWLCDELLDTSTPTDEDDLDDLADEYLGHQYLSEGDLEELGAESEAEDEDEEDQDFLIFGVPIAGGVYRAAPVRFTADNLENQDFFRPRHSDSEEESDQESEETVREPHRNLDGGSEGAQSLAASARSHIPASGLDTIDLDNPVGDNQGGRTEKEDNAEAESSGSGCSPRDVGKDGDGDSDSDENDEDEDDDSL